MIRIFHCTKDKIGASYGDGSSSSLCAQFRNQRRTAPNGRWPLEKLFFPYYREILDFFHSYDLPVVLHSCGGITDALPLIVDVGFDALNPMEVKAGCDVVDFAREYGDKLALIGNIDLVHTLPYGTIEEVKQEVVRRIKVVGKNGGYCVGSANTITSNIPLENYIAMIDAVYEYGKY